MGEIRKIHLFVLICSATLLTAAFTIFSILQPTLTVANNSGQWVKELSVRAADHEVVLSHINPGGQQTKSLRVNSDGAYTVSGEFENEAQIADTIGYVTPGMLGQRDTIVIQEDGSLIYQPGSWRPRLSWH